MKTPKQKTRGMTLIELMVGVAIVGILSSTAYSNFKYFSLRARKAERDQMMTALVKTAQDYLVTHDFVVPGGTMTCNWNPALPVTSQKGTLDWTQAGWNNLALKNFGQVYYHYYLYVSGAPNQIYFILQAEGDLDGNGILNVRSQQWNLTKSAWSLASDTETGDAF